MILNELIQYAFRYRITSVLIYFLKKKENNNFKKEIINNFEKENNNFKKIK